MHRHADASARDALLCSREALPVSLQDAPALFRAASTARDTYGLTRVPATEPETAEYIEVALAEQVRGQSLPFAISDARTGRAAGFDPLHEHRALDLAGKAGRASSA